MNGCRACSFSDRARDPGRGAPARECAGALILVQRELMRVQHLMDVHLSATGTSYYFALVPWCCLVTIQGSDVSPVLDP
jgi:hypothetical protein